MTVRTAHDRHCPHPAVAIVHGTPVPGPIQTPVDLSEAITTSLRSEGLDVTVEVASTTTGRSRHLFMVMTGQDATVVAAALTLAPRSYGLMRATAERRLGTSM